MNLIFEHGIWSFANAEIWVGIGLILFFGILIAAGVHNKAGAALDALAQRGKISAEQVQDAWEGALKDVDLQVFEVNVRAAFDSTEQGARRLAAALEAQLGEALRRTLVERRGIGHRPV